MMRAARWIAWVLVLCLCTAALPTAAENGAVTYDGNAGQFVFAPGSDYSPTDLFPNFKDVMPGDSLTQTITLKNDADYDVKVKVYMRALGAHEGSEEFLSQLHLTVQGEETVYFDAAASETDGLTDWTYLGLLYSGGETDLTVTLTMPTSVDNTFKDYAGYLDWEFMVEEYPVEPDDPGQTGEDTNYSVMIWVAAGAAVLVLLLLLLKRRRNDDE